MFISYKFGLKWVSGLGNMLYFVILFINEHNFSPPHPNNKTVTEFLFGDVTKR